MHPSLVFEYKSTIRIGKRMPCKPQLKQEICASNRSYRSSDCTLALPPEKMWKPILSCICSLLHTVGVYLTLGLQLVLITISHTRIDLLLYLLHQNKFILNFFFSYLDCWQVFNWCNWRGMDCIALSPKFKHRDNFCAEGTRAPNNANLNLKLGQ